MYLPATAENFFAVVGVAASASSFSTVAGGIEQYTRDGGCSPGIVYKLCQVVWQMVEALELLDEVVLD